MQDHVTCHMCQGIHGVHIVVMVPVFVCIKCWQASVLTHLP